MKSLLMVQLTREEIESLPLRLRNRISRRWKQGILHGCSGMELESQEERREHAKSARHWWSRAVEKASE